MHSERPNLYGAFAFLSVKGFIVSLPFLGIWYISSLVAQIQKGTGNPVLPVLGLVSHVGPYLSSQNTHSYQQLVVVSSAIQEAKSMEKVPINNAYYIPLTQ